MKKVLAVAVMLAFGSVMVACAADAKENWTKNCKTCHGEDGAGKTKMGEKLKIRDLTDGKVQAELKDDHMLKAIKEGIKDGDTTKMKAFGDVLSDDEIKELVKHVRSFKK